MHRSPIRRIALAALTLCCAVVTLSAGPAAAALKYRSPGYLGTTKAPPTKASPAKVTGPGLGLKVILGATSRDGAPAPQVLVDAAGTGHFVWETVGAGSMGVVHYCRLPRGARSCAARHAFPPGPVEGSERKGPRLVTLGDELAMLVSGRLFTSEDGGATWDGPGAANVTFEREIVGFEVAGSPIIGTLAVEGGSAVFQALRAGSQAATRVVLGAAAIENRTSVDFDRTQVSLALDKGRPVAAFSDNNQTVVRKWTGNGDIADASTWTAPRVVRPAWNPRLAAGPAGVYMLTTVTERPIPGAHQIRRVNDGVPGPPTVFGEPRASVGDSAALGLYQDPGGLLHARVLSGGVVRRTSRDGRRWSPNEVIDREGAFRVNLAAAADGGGFAVYVGAKGIAARGFGASGPTGAAGLGGLRGGAGAAPSAPSAPGTSSGCRSASFGAVTIQPQGGCLLNALGARAAGTRVSEGPIDLNGLRIEPEAGVKILINARERTLNTTGSVRVLLANATTKIPLWRGELHIRLPEANAGQTLFSFDTSKFGVDVLGFGVRGRVDVVLTADGVRIPVALALPKILGDVRGNAVLLASKGKGLRLDSLRLQASGIFIGPLMIENLDIKYEQTAWEGAATLRLPPANVAGALSAKVAFADGAYRSGQFALGFPSPGIVIGPAVYLNEINGGLALEPTKITAGVVIGAGTPAIGGVSPIKGDGKLTFTFPASGPATFRMDGTVSLFLLKLGEAFVEFQSDGYAAFGGRAALDLGPLHVGGEANGSVDATTGRFGAQLTGDVCLRLKIEGFDAGCVGFGVDAAVSDKGLAACAEVKVPLPFSAVTGSRVSGGIELPWADVEPAAFANPLLAVGTVATHLRFPCSTAEYRAPLRRLSQHQAGARVVPLEGGAPSQTLLVTGEGQAPDVTVTGPDGKRAGYRVQAPGVDATYVVLPKPAAGSYTVTPNAGSAPVTGVLTSTGYRPASAQAVIRRNGRLLSLRYAVKDATNGQSVAFLEQGAFGERRIGTARSARGVLHFKAAEARGRTRKVIAQVQRDGVILRRKTVAHFVAPLPAAPRRASAVRVLRKGPNATITWRAPRGTAAGWIVTVRGSHGRRSRHVLPDSKRLLRLRGLAPGDRLTVLVTGRSSSGRRGATALGIQRKAPRPR